MKSEPIWILVGGGTTLVQAVLQLLVAFDVPITSVQASAITTVAGLILSAIARSRVSPV